MTGTRVEATELPDDALLAYYRDAGAYTDCYAIDVPADVTLARYVAAFYCTWIFRLERVVIRTWTGIRSTDDEAVRLGAGDLDRFAAWTVEARSDEQLLLRDLSGRTRSWLMVAAGGGGAPSAVRQGSRRLYFGSAIVPVVDPATGRRALGRGFRALLRFHRIYSVVLLRAAAARLRRKRR